MITEFKLFENVKYIAQYTECIEPIIIGAWRECYENARIEYFERKKLGENVKYCIGNVFGEEPGVADKWVEMTGLHHAWVVVDDKYVSDSTPFKYGNGANTEDLPEELASSHFRNPIYKCVYFVDEKELKQKLKFFPKR